MSFANLRSARQSKESKSFVNAGPSTSEDTGPAVPQGETIEASVSSSTSLQLEVLADHPWSLPTWLNIRKSSAHGRGVYAKESFAPGTILSSVRPRVSVLSTPNLDSFCSHCATPEQATALRRCTGCLTVRYCNSACQNSDWSSHKPECRALQRWASSAPSVDVAIPSDAVRCLGRMLWGMRKKGLDSNWTKELKLLESHRGSLPQSSYESHTLLAHSIVRYIGASSPNELEPYGIASAADLVDFISRFTTNTFTLTSYSLAPIGICVTPSVALVNHSCDPNAVIVFPRSSKPSTPEPIMQLIALRPIAADEEILISYIDTTIPKELRQTALRETYDFVCQCTLCSVDTLADPRGLMHCPKACGGTCPLPTEENEFSRCSTCRAVVSSTDAVLDAVRVGQEALDKASALQFKDPAKSRQLTTNMIPILTSAGLTPSCHPLLAMTRLDQEHLIASLGTTFTQDVLDDTIRVATKYSTGLGNILTYGHPVRAVALAELGKLLAVDEPSPPEQGAVNSGNFPPHGSPRLKLAYQTLVQARNEMAIGFGRGNEGGQLGLELREALVRIEKELGVWEEGVRNALRDAKSSRSTA